MTLNPKWIALVGRIALALIFLVSGVGKIADWNGTAAMMAAQGMPAVPLFLAGAIALEVLGALSIMAGFKTRWGVHALVFFLVPTTYLFHGFWAYQGLELQMQLAHFLKNVGIAGGLLVLAAAGPGAISLDARLAPGGRLGRTQPQAA